MRTGQLKQTICSRNRADGVGGTDGAPPCSVPSYRRFSGFGIQMRWTKQCQRKVWRGDKIKKTEVGVGGAVAEFACIAKDHNSCGSFPHSAGFPTLECILICTRKSPFRQPSFASNVVIILMAPLYSRTTKTSIPKITVRTLEWRVVVMTEAPLPDVPGCPSATNFPDLMLNPVELKQLLSFTAGT